MINRLERWTAAGLLLLCSLTPFACDPKAPQEPTSERRSDGGAQDASRQPDAASLSLKDHALGPFRVTLDAKGLKIARSDGAVLLQSPQVTDGSKSLPTMGWRKSEATVTELLGSYVFEEDPPPWSTGAPLQARLATDKKIALQSPDITGTLELDAKGALKVHWKLRKEGSNRLIQAFDCQADDRFFGLGARVHGTEHRGEVIHNWVSEQGIGKLRRTTPKQGFPLKGGIHDTYLPVPFVMTQRGLGLLVENSERSVFHLCPKGAEKRWAVEVWSPELRYRLFHGPTGLDVLEQLTSHTGRPKLSPKWAYAPWLDATHGQQKVLEVAKKLRKEKIASSIIWTEDWVGAFEDARGYHLHYQWNHDPKLYPDLKQLSSQLHGMGFKFLGYFNPFLREGSPQWKEAHEKGYAIKDARGEIIYFTGVFGKKTTLPDFSDAKVVAWAQGYMKAAVALGFDGWMADYAEWLPTTARMHDGSSGMSAHNRYPLLWQKTNRDALDAARSNGDYVFFVRSGWAGTGGLAPVVWAGDQQTSFDDNDGLQTIIPLTVDAGMSGIPVMTHDIAGYSSVGVKPSTKELFFRWTQLGAFSAIMRTHHGSYGDQNWNWHKDPQTLAMFRTYTQLNVSLFPYRYTLAQQASQRGWPLVRHLFLHYPKDPKVSGIKDAYLLGPSLLVAPVMVDGARERKVYLPAGRRWFHFFTGTGYEGGTRPAIPASLEEIPVFAPAGAIIPMWKGPIDTLAPSTDEQVVDLQKAEAGTLQVRVYLGASGSFTMYDGTQFELTFTKTPASDPTVELGGQGLPACTAAPKDSCVELKERALTLYISPTRDAFTLQSKGFFSMQIKAAPKAKKYEFHVRW